MGKIAIFALSLFFFTLWTQVLTLTEDEEKDTTTKAFTHHAYDTLDIDKQPKAEDISTAKEDSATEAFTNPAYNDTIGIDKQSKAEDISTARDDLSKVDQKIFCKSSLKPCKQLKGYCLTKDMIKHYENNGQCTKQKTFAHDSCPTCYCCVPVPGPNPGVPGPIGPNPGGPGPVGPNPGGPGPTDTNPGGSGPDAPSQTCEANEQCSKYGGQCSMSGSCAGFFSNKFCGGTGGCGCCLSLDSVAGGTASQCENTDKCSRRNGICCGKDSCTSGTFVEKYCGKGKDCGCCIVNGVNPQCSTTKKCQRKGGVCSSSSKCTLGSFTHKYCGGGTDCGCCTMPKCKAKRSCMYANGICKFECSGDEKEVPNGCKGDSCKCCVSDLDNCKASKKCIRKGGHCCPKEACGDYPFYDKLCGKGCGCCIHY